MYEKDTEQKDWHKTAHKGGLFLWPAQNYDGIQDVRKLETAGLDIDGTDAHKIMQAAEAAAAVMQTG